MEESELEESELYESEMEESDEEMDSESESEAGRSSWREEGEYILDGGFGAWLPVESVGDDYGCGVTGGGGITWDVFAFWGSVAVVWWWCGVGQFCIEGWIV